MGVFHNAFSGAKYAGKFFEPTGTFELKLAIIYDQNLKKTLKLKKKSYLEDPGLCFFGISF